MEINGVINIYKEEGFTSHDVVAKLRGILHQKKIGHTGTLDPAARGVLPVCAGRGTRLCSLLTDHDKVYETVLLLGVVTDTQDMTGTVLETRPVHVTEGEIRECIRGFVGEQLQVPPMYSAKKINGKKLYELAREGKTVEREAVPITIYDIEILEMKLPEIRLSIHCSKGTYIRTICNDIGEKLGCGGSMKTLLRTKVGEFLLKDAVTLETVEQYVQEGRIEELVTTPEMVFREAPAAKGLPAADKLLHNGNSIFQTMTENTAMEAADGEQFRMYDSRDVFIGLYQKKGEKLSPVKMFYQNDVTVSK